VIYATDRVTGANLAKVYQIDPTTGAQAQIALLANGQWFRDIAGSNVVFLPEPGTGSLLLLGGVALLPLVRRRFTGRSGRNRKS